MLRHSLGQPSRSDFVQFQFVRKSRNTRVFVKTSTLVSNLLRKVLGNEVPIALSENSTIKDSVHFNF